MQVKHVKSLYSNMQGDESVIFKTPLTPFKNLKEGLKYSVLHSSRLLGKLEQILTSPLFQESMDVNSYRYIIGELL